MILIVFITLAVTELTTGDNSTLLLTAKVSRAFFLVKNDRK